MDPQSRQTASVYINNLLLSRGLLRNGTPIEFAKPEEAEGGLTGTMSQVMNLVHDLILRRDVRIHPESAYRPIIPHEGGTPDANVITRCAARGRQLDEPLYIPFHSPINDYLPDSHDCQIRSQYSSFRPPARSHHCARTSGACHASKRGN